MAITSTGVQNGKATTIKKTFSRQTAISIEINADAAVIWALLTSAADIPRWNSTILSIQGRIAAGEKIKLVSTLDKNVRIGFSQSVSQIANLNSC